MLNVVTGMSHYFIINWHSYMTDWHESSLQELTFMRMPK